MTKKEIDTKFEIAEILAKHLDVDTSEVLSPLYDYLQKKLILSGVSQQRELLIAYEKYTMGLDFEKSLDGINEFLNSYNN